MCWPDEWRIYGADSIRFFHDPLPGGAEALGSPAGAQSIGPLGVDTDRVAAFPARDPEPTE